MVNYTKCCNGSYTVSLKCSSVPISAGEGETRQFYPFYAGIEGQCLRYSSLRTYETLVLLQRDARLVPTDYYI